MTETERQPRWTAYVPLAEILRAPRNPKTHATQVIAESVSRFGVVELPALDERTGRLVAGHGRLDDWVARYTAGDEPPDGVRKADDGGWLVPVNRGWASRSDADAEAYLVVSNRSTELGGWDTEELAQTLADLKDEGLLEFTGYDDGDLDDLLKLQAAPDLDLLADDIGEPHEDDGWVVVRAKVPTHVAAAWRTKVEEHSGSEHHALAALLEVDPFWAPASDWTP